MKKSNFWTRTNIMLLAIVVEHALIFFASIVDNMILEVPKRVITSETKRKKLQRRALREIERLKLRRKNTTANIVELDRLETIVQKRN